MDIHTDQTVSAICRPRASLHRQLLFHKQTLNRYLLSTWLMPGTHLLPPLLPSHPQIHSPNLECSFLTFPQAKLQSPVEVTSLPAELPLMFPIHLLSPPSYWGENS